jgi:predicted metal-dependent hydrolase
MSESLSGYQLRVSRRSRNVRLRVTVQHGLEVIVPVGYDTARLPALLERKKHWIRAAMDRAESHRKFFEPRPTWKIPGEITLPVIGVTWHVVAKESSAPWVAVREVEPRKLVIFGAIGDESATRAALARWLMRQTREILGPRVETISQKIRVKYRRVLVKRQKTRWASCSRRRSISLNMKLLFLPRDLVDYVIIHELCHVTEMSHSRQFWLLVERHCANFREFDRKLRDMWKVIPTWAA